jgi:hypothetical protein
MQTSDEPLWKFYFNTEYSMVLENLKSMKINYLKSLKTKRCNDELDFFEIWLKYLNYLEEDEYFKVVNENSGEIIINKRTERYLQVEDVLNQNPLKLNSILWKNYEFSNKFIEDFSCSNNKDNLLKALIAILSGDFNESLLVLSITTKKLLAVYSLNFSKNESLYFSIYFGKRKNETKCREFINFLGVFKNNQLFLDWFQDFRLEFENNNSKYPEIEYDPMGILNSSEILFYDKISKYSFQDKFKSKKSYFLRIPHPMIYSKNESHSFDFFSKKINPAFINNIQQFYLTKGKMETFDLICYNESKKHKKIIKILKEEKIEIALSMIEKSLILEKNNLIISGRSGTGKTTIIIFKILFSFMNFYLFKYSHLLEEEFSWLNIFLPIEKKNENLKIVFSSFSNSLCAKVEKLYQSLYDAVAKILNLNLIYNKVYERNINNFNSFYEVNKFPIFLNFRKIIFLIDGTLSTQFFHREYFNKVSKLDDDCDLEFKYNIKYFLNNYPKSLDFKTKTFFLRSPENQGKIEKIEVNEVDFEKSFFKRYLKNELVQSAKDKKLNHSFIFSQIHSIIKGSINSHFSNNNCITLEEYHQVGSKFSELNFEEKSLVYEIYMEYGK